MWNNMPPELLGKIFGHLTVLDILRLKLVNRTFRDVISSDPRLQYECELAAAGFLDNPNAPGTIFDRRRSLRSCLEMKPVGKQSLSLGLTRLYYTPQRSGDVFVTYDTSRNTLHFCRPPSASGSRPTKTWSFPLNFDFQGGYFLIHFPFDLIVIADNLSGRLHLRSIANGEPHPLASHEWIDHGLDASAFLMVSVSDHTLAARIQGRLVAWNWRTGTKVLDRNDLHHGWMAFIGADCLLVADSLFMEDDTRRLVLFDMSGMEETPAAVRGVTFMYDPRYQNTQVRPVAEGAGHSDYSQAIGEDFPFYPDPSRRIFGLVFEPIGQDWIALGLFLVHSEAFIGLARKTGEGIIAWDAWEEYTIAADMHGDPRAGVSTRYSVLGSRFVRFELHKTEKWAKFRLYDLSRWSRQQSDMGLDGRGGLDKKVGFRLIEGVFDLPQSTSKPRDAAMFHDCLVYFTVGSSTIVPRSDVG